MTLIAVKIVDRNNPEGAAQSRGALTGAGFKIVYDDEADGILVDASKASHGDDAYGGAWVIVGKKD